MILLAESKAKGETIATVADEVSADVEVAVSAAPVSPELTAAIRSTAKHRGAVISRAESVVIWARTVLMNTPR